MRTDIKTLYIDFDGTLVNTIESIVGLYNEDFKYYKNFNYIRWWDIDTWGFEECNCAPLDILIYISISLDSLKN